MSQDAVTRVITNCTPPVAQEQRRAARWSGLALCGVFALAIGAVMLAGGCDSDRDAHNALVTIDIRCDSNADCPAGFACQADAEHGPPTTMCESPDESVSCPPGFETQVGYGQTFCKPHSGVSSRGGHGSKLITVRPHKLGRTVSGHGGGER